MPEPRPRATAANTETLLREIAAGMAAGDQKFDELFRRIHRAEEVAGEARDVAREIITKLEAQNMAMRIDEVRSEARALVATLREDVVAADLTMRREHEALATRVGGLESLRTEGRGAAKGFALTVRIAALAVAAGGGATLIKLLEMVK